MVIFPSFPSFMVYAFALLHSGLELEKMRFCEAALFALKAKINVFEPVDRFDELLDIDFSLVHTSH